MEKIVSALTFFCKDLKEKFEEKKLLLVCFFIPDFLNFWPFGNCNLL